MKQAKKIKKITPKYLENAGLAYLERFSASSKHFEKVMKRKIKKSLNAHPEIDETQCLEWLKSLIEKFEKYGYLNDTQYALSLAKSSRYKGYAKPLSLKKMLEKGVPKELAIHQLKQVDSSITEKLENIDNADFISAIRLCKKRRIGPFAKLALHKKEDYQKSLSALARSGHSYDISVKVLNMTFEECEEILKEVF